MLFAFSPISDKTEVTVWVTPLVLTRHEHKLPLLHAGIWSLTVRTEFN